MRSVLRRVLIAAILSSVASAFNFSTGAPTECDNLNITWTGGEPPFQLLISPSFGVQHNISIPDSAFNNNKGTFSTQLNIAQKRKFLLMMSDNTGIGSGGTSQLLTVGPSLSGSSCNTSDAAPGFTYQLNSALQQCRPYPFTDYALAAQPLTIIGLIPDGNTTILTPPNGPSFDWTVNAAAGTDMMFVIVDAQGKQGGCSDLLTVGSSDDSSCLNQLSPSTTASPTPSSTGTGSAGGTNTKVSIGAIVGTVLGGILVIAMLVTLGLFFLRRYKGGRRSPYGGDDFGGFGPSRRRSHRLASIDLASGLPSSRPFGGSRASNVYAYPSPNSATSLTAASPAFVATSGQYEPRPFTLPATSNLHTRSSSKTEPGSPFTDGEPTQSGRQKAALAGATAYKPARFIVHNDLEEAGPSEVVEEVVELPPQYTDRRLPQEDISQQPSSSSRRQVSNSIRKRPSSYDIQVPPIPPTSNQPPPPFPPPPPGDTNWM